MSASALASLKSSSLWEVAQRLLPSGVESERFLKLLEGDEKWNSEKTLMLVSIVHVMIKPEDTVCDWEIVAKKLQTVVPKGGHRNEWTFTGEECEQRFMKLMDITQKSGKGSFSSCGTWDTRELIIQIVGLSLLNEAQLREKRLMEEIIKLHANLKQMDVQSDAEFATSVHNMSDAEGSDSDIEDNSDQEKSGEVSSKQKEEGKKSAIQDQSKAVEDGESISDGIHKMSIYEMFAACFVVNNGVLDAPLSDEKLDELLKRFDGGKADGTTVPTDSDKVRTEKDKWVVVVHDPVPQAKFNEFYKNLQEGHVSNGEVKRTVPTGAPTLTKLLELPPGAKLEQTSDMEVKTIIIDKIENANARSSPDSQNITGMNPPSSPMRNKSPRKLLEALGTTTTPLHIVPETAFSTSPVKMSNSSQPNIPISPLKLALEGKEIRSDQKVVVDLPSTSVVTTISPGETKKVLASPSKGPSDSDSEKIKELLNEKPDGEETKEKQDDNMTDEGVDIAPPCSIVKEEKMIAGTLEETSLVVEQLETPEDQSLIPEKAPSDIGTPTVAADQSTVKTNEAKVIGEGETGESSTSEKLRGRKEVSETPTTRHAIKDKVKQEEGQNEKSTRRTSMRTVQQEDIPKSSQRRHGSKSSGDFNTPNLRSRGSRVPTPTIGEDETKIAGRRGKTAGEKEETKDKGKDPSEGTDIVSDSSAGGESSAKKSKKDDEVSVEGADDESVKSVGDSEESHSKRRSNAGTPVNESTTEEGSSKSSTAPKRITRRSVKIVETPEITENAVKEEDSQREGRTRMRQPRLRAIGEDTSEKDKEEEGKRITRARAKSSGSPGRTRTKSSSSTKSGADMEASDSESSSSRTTRRKSAGTPTMTKPLGMFYGDIDLSKASAMFNPEPNWRRPMLRLLKRLARNPHAHLFNLPTGEELERYRKVIRKVWDIPSLQRSIIRNEIKTRPEFERELSVFFVNYLMWPANVFKNADNLFREVANDFGHQAHELRPEYLPVGPPHLRKESLAPTEYQQYKKTWDVPDTDEEDDEVYDQKMKQMVEKLLESASKETSTSTASKNRGKRPASPDSAAEEAPETKRRMLRTSTAAATAASTSSASWQNTRQRKPPTSSPDISTLGR